jgi:hypothetical protein
LQPGKQANKKPWSVVVLKNGLESGFIIELAVTWHSLTMAMGS